MDDLEILKVIRWTLWKLNKDSSLEVAREYLEEYKERKNMILRVKKFVSRRR